LTNLRIYFEISVECWKEIALLVFCAGLGVGKNQMCNLCGGLFFNEAQRLG